MSDLPELPVDLDVGALPPPAEASCDVASAWLTPAAGLLLGVTHDGKTGQEPSERFRGHPLALEAGDEIVVTAALAKGAPALCAVFGPWREVTGYGLPLDWQVFAGELELRFRAAEGGLYLVALGSPWKQKRGYRITARCVDRGCGPAAPRYGSPQRCGETPELLGEASGIAASPGQAGVLWSHNDGGGPLRLLALARDGGLLGRFVVPDLDVEDVEDIAIGPGPGGSYHLYVGDLGDNDERRESVSVVRLVEPELPGFGALLADARGQRGFDDPHAERRIPGSRVERFELRYPDRPRDAETLCVEPRSGDVYIVTKATKGKRSAHVYRARAPLRSGVLEHVTRLRLGKGALEEASHTRVTGGDIAPSGEELVLRTRDEALLWRKPPGCGWGRALMLRPWRVALSGHEQGEAIAFSGEDGGSLYTLGEGRREPLMRLPRLG